jgi:nucleoside-triphosphatase THEP1
MDHIVLITGERGVGKTHLCQTVVQEAQRRGYTCAGLLSPAYFEGQEKIGISLVDVASGEERPLATADDVPGGARWGRYRFVDCTLEWGTRVLAEAGPCDLLVVDELGPLELEKGRGFVHALDVLVEGRFCLALAVVRPELLDEVRGRLQGEELDLVEVTLANREELPLQIVSKLAEGGEKPDLRSSSK